MVIRCSFRGPRRILQLPVGSAVAPCCGTASGHEQSKAKMSKKTKRAPATKGRPAVREASGMRAELELFKRERILQEMIETVYERGAQQLVTSIEGYLDSKSPPAKRLHDFVRGFALQNIESRAV